MELTEIVDLRSINYLSNLSFETFVSYVKWDDNMKFNDKKKMHKAFMFFCESNIKCGGEMKRVYSYSMNEVKGRLFSGGSVQSLTREIRGAIMKHTTDIDMQNAHPKILLYLCKKYNILCPNLTYFCDNRDEIFKSVSDDKDYAKKLFLKAVNSDKRNRTEKNQTFKNFDKEMKQIQFQLCNHPDFIDIVRSVPDTRKYNFLGSIINRILCVYENAILQEVINVITNTLNLEIAVLMFDGLMIYGTEFEDIALIDTIEEHVNREFQGLDMVFTIKEHSNEIVIPEDYVIPTLEEVKQSKNDKINELVLERSFEKVCEEFEKTHSKLINKACFVKENDNGVIMMTRTQLTTAYENLDYQVKDYTEDVPKIKLKPFINMWLKYPQMRCYDDVGVYPHPLVCPERILNIWKPFRAELITEYTEKPDVIPMFINHIKVLSGNNDIVCEYLISWLAQMFQFPAVKTICPVIISKEGAGKGTLIDIINKLVGKEKYYETATPSRDVWGDFNGRMAGSFFVNLNELSKKETTDSMSAIKALITDTRMTINNKGCPQYEIQSYHRFLITTNNEEPINTTKDDRRKLFIRSSDELISNIDYFTNFRREIIDDDNAIRTIYNYLMNKADMDKFHSIPLPKTEYQIDLQELSISPIENWLKLFVEENIDEVEVKIKSSDVYNLFNEWLKLNKIKFEMNNLQFSVRLKRLNINGIETQKGSKGIMNTIFNLNLLKKHFNLGCLLDV